MKWLWIVLGLTAAMVTWTVIKPLDQAPAVVVTPAPVPSVSSDRQFEAPETQTDVASPPSQLPVIESIDELGGDDKDRVINIGEPLDPDDPFTWAKSESTEVINIGEPMDPDDPSTWPQSESTEVINIGEPMDPDDPSTWPQSESTEVINIGELVDPEDSFNLPRSDSSEVITIGEPMDPDDPAT
jgi:hypothetical protein